MNSRSTESPIRVQFQVVIILSQILQISMGTSEIDGADITINSVNNPLELSDFLIKDGPDDVSASKHSTKNSTEPVTESQSEVVRKLLKKTTNDFGSLHTIETLIYWANKEEEIYKVVKKRRIGLKKEMDLINKYLKDYRKSSGKALENMIVPSEDPKLRGKVIGSSAILAHLMTYRYSTTVRDLRSFLGSKERRGPCESLKSILDIGPSELDETHSFFQRMLGPTVENKPKIAYNWPNWQDLYMSNMAILNMHTIYGFYPSQFYKGFEIDTNAGGSLKASHCMEIGMFALSRGYYYMAIEWLEFANTLLESKTDLADSSAPLDFLMSLLEAAIFKHNQIKTVDSKDWTQEDIDNYLNTYTTRTFAGQQKSQRRRGRTAFFKRSAAQYGNETTSVLNFLSICSGKSFQPEEIKSRLKCFLERKLHPYFLLNPVKVEQLSQYPYVVQMYDVLGEDTIKWLYEVRRTDVNISPVGSLSDIAEASKVRTSASQVVGDVELRKKINRKSELITGLVVNDYEEYVQAVDYVYGRHYGFHSDVYSSFTNNEVYETVENFGNRLATLLYYVEEPIVGGITPFCSIGTYAEVKKGSAVFWLNMYRNGTFRSDVDHGACPVIHGHKTIMNQWIRYKANFQTFKCSLDQFE